MKHFYQNKKVIITGASSGIGEYLARTLASFGAKPILLARREQKLQEICLSLKEQGFDASFFPLDISDPTQVLEVGERLLEQEQQIDILINNAGIMKLGPFEKLSLNQHQAMVATNLLGSIYLTHFFLPHFLLRGTGNIAFVASLVGHVNLKNFNTYSATKFALIGLAEGLRAELKGRKIYLHTLCPPATDTPLLENSGSSQTESYRKLSVSKVGDDLLRGIARNKKEIFCSFDSRLLVLIKRYCPSLAAKILSNY